MADTTAERAQILVLALGNPLLADDGVGRRILELLEEELAGDPRTEFVDGGTRGLCLLSHLEGRRAILLLDAVALGAEPGTPHLVLSPEDITAARGFGAHGGNACELIAAGRLLNILPPAVRLVGIEPESVRTRFGLSLTVERALPAALQLARRTLSEWSAGLAPAPAQELESCTS